MIWNLKLTIIFFFKFLIHNIYLGPFRNTPWELNVLCYLQELIFKKCEDVGANMIKWYFLTFLSSFLIQFKIYGVYAYSLIFWWPPCLKLVTWTPPKYGNNSQNPPRFVEENIYPTESCENLIDPLKNGCFWPILNLF